MRKFAFISNWRSRELDTNRMLFSPSLLNRLKPGVTRERLVNEGLFTTWTHFDVYHEVEGYIIIIFITAAEMLKKPRFARQRILEAARYARDELGVEFIGLGSYTSSVITSHGEWLVGQLAQDQQADERVRPVYVTHGDSHATGVAVGAVTKLLPLDLPSKTLAIVGAYGLIGEALSRLLCKKCSRLLLIGPRLDKLSALQQLLLSENGQSAHDVDISTEDSDIIEADVVITATSNPSAIIQPHWLKEDAWVYDIAQPMNTSPALMAERPDIQVVDGSFVNIPGIDLGIDFGTPEGTAYACFGELVMQCLEDNRQSHVGRIDLTHVRRTGRWAEKHGFTHAEPTCFGQPIFPQVSKDKWWELARVAAIL